MSEQNENIMSTKTTLQSICEKYAQRHSNDDNYSIGGGLDSSKFASRRHEDARSDAGKLTLGEATQLFKKATGLTVNEVREIIEYTVPNMEWHHAGKLPKSYGGGMKKTYFLNADEICNVASKLDENMQKLALSKIAAKRAAEEKNNSDTLKLQFLKANATQLIRVKERPMFFYLTAREMDGKYGWFDSTYKSYNIPEYFSGWAFENEQKYHEFLNIK